MSVSTNSLYSLKNCLVEKSVSMVDTKVQLQTTRTTLFTQMEVEYQLFDWGRSNPMDRDLIGLPVSAGMVREG